MERLAPFLYEGSESEIDLMARKKKIPLPQKRRNAFLCVVASYHVFVYVVMYFIGMGGRSLPQWVAFVMVGELFVIPFLFWGLGATRGYIDGYADGISRRPPKFRFAFRSWIGKSASGLGEFVWLHDNGETTWEYEDIKVVYEKLRPQIEREFYEQQE